jgi:hypothetical protein
MLCVVLSLVDHLQLLIGANRYHMRLVDAALLFEGHFLSRHIESAICNPSEMNTITLPSELSLPATNS